MCVFAPITVMNIAIASMVQENQPVEQYLPYLIASSSKLVVPQFTLGSEDVLIRIF